MLNLSTKEFREMLVESCKKIEDLKLESTDTVSEIRRLSQKKDGIEKDIKAQKDKSEAIQNALVIVQGVSSNISQMRGRLLRKMEKSKREDITITESKNLRTEIETLKTELQKVCSHPFVYDEPGYEGSPSQEYEDRHPNIRYCVVCGLEEKGKSNGQYDYVGTRFEKLAEVEARIIENQPWTPEGRKRVDIWIPLGAVLKPFEDSVVRVLNG